ncbi:MAG: hypothetical protein ACRYG7_43550 [Janthinobacterium lividum]
MIHSRGQAGQDPVHLKHDWLAALRYGCDRGHVQLPAVTVVEFAYYGDLLAANPLAVLSDKSVSRITSPRGTLPFKKTASST